MYTYRIYISLFIDAVVANYMCGMCNDCLIRNINYTYVFIVAEHDSALLHGIHDNHMNCVSHSPPTVACLTSNYDYLYS